jgi:NADPH-dependent F420 reductase
MRIAVIGTGMMAEGLGTGWSRAGHTIVFGSRTPADRAELAARVAGSRVLAQADAVSQGEVVVLAIPYEEVEPFARLQATRLRGRLVIDISNPFDALPDNRLAGAEITAATIGEGARVVAAFKDNFAHTLGEPADRKAGLVRDVHYAGGNAADKAIVATLITDLGFRPIDCGALRNARVLDSMVPLMIELDRRYGGEARSSWKYLV